MTRRAAGAGPEGTTLAGRYEIGALLGTGGMAQVHAARDNRLGREVAVKVLRTDLSREPSFVQRFRREAQSAARLTAPAIVGVLDTGEDADGIPFIVMEKVDGRTLRDVLAAEGRLTPRRALTVAGGVLGALEVAHAAGIVHRDIKPGNVMLTARDEVKVMDFGIARAVTDSAATMTQTASVLGTAAYLSPEQARGEHVDSRADVYSTGCLLYELLTGAPPFSGDNAVAVAYQHVREDPALPSAYDPSLPATLDAIVLKAMAKSPAARYQSAAEMRADLLRALEDDPRDPVLAPPTTTTLSVAPALARDARTLAAPAPPTTARKVLLGVTLVLLTAVTAMTALLVKGLVDNDDPLVAAPALVGLSRDAAIGRLGAEGLALGRIDVVHSDKPLGSVIEQTPAEGILLQATGSVDLRVSKGPQITVVPDVRSLPQAEAEAQLKAFALVLAEVIPRDGNIAAGTVLEVIPAPGTNLKARSEVRLVVASGLVEVPDVVGTTQDEAAARLQAAGFSVGVLLQDDLGPAGVVLQQDPRSTKAPRGSVVVVTVSRTPGSSPSPSPTPDPQPSF